MFFTKGPYQDIVHHYGIITWLSLRSVISSTIRTILYHVTFPFKAFKAAFAEEKSYPPIYDNDIEIYLHRSLRDEDFEQLENTHQAMNLAMNLAQGYQFHFEVDIREYSKGIYITGHTFPIIQHLSKHLTPLDERIKQGHLLLEDLIEFSIQHNIGLQLDIKSGDYHEILKQIIHRAQKNNALPYLKNISFIAVLNRKKCISELNSLKAYYAHQNIHFGRIGVMFWRLPSCHDLRVFSGKVEEIKVFDILDGGVFVDIQNISFTSIVQEARKAGIEISVGSYTAEGLRRAYDAGVRKFTTGTPTLIRDAGIFPLAERREAS